MITLILDWFLNMTIYITSHSTLTKTAPHKTPLLRKDTIIGLSKSPTNGVLRLKIGGLNPKKVPNSNSRRVGSKDYLQLHILMPNHHLWKKYMLERKTNAFFLRNNWSKCFNKFIR